MKPVKIKKEKKGLKKIISNIRQFYKKSSPAGKAALIFLAVLVAIGLLLLLGAVACGIACDGAEGIAYVIAILGTAGIIYALVRVIQRITKGPRKKPAEIKPS